MATIDLSGEPDRATKAKYQRRIEFASRFRFKHNRVPTLDELDAVEPLEFDLHRSVQAREVWQERNQKRKALNGGIIGIIYAHDTRRWVTQIKSRSGQPLRSYYSTALEAAKKYNEWAATENGDLAVYCDLEAAKRLDERMSALDTSR